MKKTKKVNEVGKITSTNDLFRLNQSINQKTERSERDVINSFNWTIAALFLLVFVDLLVSIAGL